MLTITRTANIMVVYRKYKLEGRPLKVVKLEEEDKVFVMYSFESVIPHKIFIQPIQDEI